MFTLLSALLIGGSLSVAVAVGLLLVKYVLVPTLDTHDEQLLVSVAVSLVAVVMLQGFLSEIPVALPLILTVALLLLLFLLNRYFITISPIGILFYVGSFTVLSMLPVWTALFLFSLDVSHTSKLFLFVSLLPLSAIFPFSILQHIEQYDVLCRDVWYRPRTTKKLNAEDHQPFVSIHIPTYAEPPALVIATIKSVLALEYENYEVIVLDNNTKDESLWRPVEAFCQTQAQNVRFCHYEQLSGAKAGALNVALSLTDKRAEVVSVIDADYRPRPSFLSDLLGHFTDQQVGFVQTPHDYRGWERNTFLEMCYFEYKAFFYTVMVALNEKRSGLTVGTMCLIRKTALEAAGGWSEWCVTEDSELAIRIHNAGYTSVYIPESYGQGLIPERFTDYAKQRARWVAGPVQEMKHYSSMFFGTAAIKTQLSPLQRLHHFNHGFGSVLFGVQVPLLVLAVGAALSMVVHEEIVTVPFALWFTATVQVVTLILLNVLVYTKVVKCSIKQMVYALIANKALLWTTQLSALKTLINQEQPWQRTSKFKEVSTMRGAVRSSQVELLLSLSLVSLAVVCFVFMPYAGLLSMLLLGIFFRGLEYAMAPVVSVVSLRCHKSATTSQSNVYTPKSVLDLQTS